LLLSASSIAIRAAQDQRWPDSHRLYGDPGTIDAAGRRTVAGRAGGFNLGAAHLPGRDCRFIPSPTGRSPTGAAVGGIKFRNYP